MQVCPRPATWDTELLRSSELCWTIVFRISSFNRNFEKDSGFVSNCFREMFLLPTPPSLNKEEKTTRGMPCITVSTASLACVLPNKQVLNWCGRAELDDDVTGHVLIQKGEAQPLPATPTVELSSSEVPWRAVLLASGSAAAAIPHLVSSSLGGRKRKLYCREKGFETVREVSGKILRSGHLGFLLQVWVSRNEEP